MSHFFLSLHFPNEPIRMNKTIVELFKHNYMSTVSTRWVWVRQLKHFPACPTVTTTLTLSHLNSWYKADVEVGTMIHSYSHVSQLLITLFHSDGSTEGEADSICVQGNSPGKAFQSRKLVTVALQSLYRHPADTMSHVFFPNFRAAPVVPDH